jgi:hypothetical protein
MARLIININPFLTKPAKLVFTPNTGNIKTLKKNLYLYFFSQIFRLLTRDYIHEHLYTRK